jgi:hypothetical protein
MFAGRDMSATDNVRALTDLTGFHGVGIAREQMSPASEERRWAGKSLVITSADAARAHP